MREKQFREIIEKQNSEEKEALWLKIQAELEQEQFVSKPKRKRLSNIKNIIAGCLSAAAVLAVGIGIGIGIAYHYSDNEIVQGNPHNPVNGSRYLSISDCDLAVSENTLKQYAENYDVELLYLDLYDQTTDYDNYLLKLKESGEDVCFGERFSDLELNYVYLYVTDNITDMDILTRYDETSGQNTTVKGITVYYKEEHQDGKANFEYKGYRYYLELKSEAYGSVLELVERMLSNI